MDKDKNVKLPRTTREILNLKAQEYTIALSACNFENILKALEYLEERRKKVKLNNASGQESIEILDKNIRRIFELMSKYEQEIKQIFIDNRETITHITNISPDNMRGGKISKSINRGNCYQTERGNWIFASSNPINGRNPYIARNSQNGMVVIDRNTYIYGGNNMQILQDEQGHNRVILKNPNYAYIINPEKFKPVVTLLRDRNGKPYFKFSEEWISNEEVDINDSRQVLSIKEIKDITELIKNYQVLCDVTNSSEIMKIIINSNRFEAIQTVCFYIREGKLRYINGEANINVSQMLMCPDIINTQKGDTQDIEI